MAVASPKARNESAYGAAQRKGFSSGTNSEAAAQNTQTKVSQRVHRGTNRPSGKRYARTGTKAKLTVFKKLRMKLHDGGDSDSVRKAREPVVPYRTSAN